MRKIRKIAYLYQQVFFQCKEIDLLLKNIITGDEKWLFCDNVPCKRQWTDKDESLRATPKAKLRGRKVMLCVYWDHYSIIHFEFLNCNQTLNADLYTEQLQHVHENPLRKMPLTRQ